VVSGRLDPNVAPFVLAPYLTVPLPAYVSFFSALSRHGMIEQIPGNPREGDLRLGLRPRRSRRPGFFPELSLPGGSAALA
jgi:hypothetical protein